MAHDLSPLSAAYHTAILDARIRRILSITAAYYSLVPAEGVAIPLGGSQV